MIAFQWTSTGSQPIISRANDTLSLSTTWWILLPKHMGCHSCVFAHHVFQETLIFAKDKYPWFIAMNPSWSLSYWTLQYLIQECTSWLNSKKLLWELSHRSQLLILHWKWLISLRFSISGIVMQLSTSYMCMTHSTMIAIVLPLTLL